MGAPMPDRPDHSDAPPARAGYLDSLNTEQREAVETTEGPVLVLAGAGTGKTRVLTARLAHLLATGLAHPGQLLAVTFTNRAASEMKERVEALVGRSVDGWHLGTFHAVAARILRRHAERCGLRSNFTIVDADDQQRLLKQVMTDNGLDDRKWPPRSVLAVIQRWKDRGLSPGGATAEADGDFADGKAASLYEQYQDRLRVLNAADFGDLLLHNISVFTAHADVLEEYRRRFRYFLVDEYQDANVAQYLWLRLLAMESGNLCCVGDDDQSIYAWRGAEVGNILRFEKDFPGARTIRLERNYRSTGHILGAASGLIAHNEGRLGKTLWTEDEAGAKVRVVGAWDGEDEARRVSDDIEAAQRRGERLRDMAILVRATFQTRAFEERFLRIGMPYRVIGGLRFYERLEIRDAVAYLRIVTQPGDDLAFERVVNTPRRGIGPATLQALHLRARERRLPMLAAAREALAAGAIRGRAGSGLAAFVGDLDRWRAGAAETGPAALMATVLEESGYTDMWKRDRSIEAPGRLDNLQELVTALEEDFDTAGAFLEHVSLVMDNAARRDEDMVNVMTLHGAKGLEFDTVFLPGWEEDVFPNRRALEDGRLKALEEERRLAYVGLTRARRRAIVLHAGNRLAFGQWASNPPSRFIAELPDGHIEKQAIAGAYYGRGGNADGVDPALFERPALGNRRSNWRRYAERGEPSPSVEIESSSGAAYSVGARVFHRKFGYGAVQRVDGGKLEIFFDKGGIRKVMDSFVEPA